MRILRCWSITYSGDGVSSRDEEREVSGRDLPATSYAVLGMLGLRSWTGYELTRQARRNLAYIWPKRESIYYEEPRRLVEHGLATSTPESAGGRRRNRYAITDAGREALARWLEAPSAPPSLENEAYLRVFFMDQGTLAAVRRTLEGLRTWAKRQRGDLLDVLEGYRDGYEPFPERRHISIPGAAALLATWDQYIAVADLLEREMSTWEDTHHPSYDARADELLGELLQRYGRG
jgi:PadR family transcriptional regulator AphA